MWLYSLMPPPSGASNTWRGYPARWGRVRAALLLVIQFTGAKEFCPNDKTHPQFGGGPPAGAGGLGYSLLCYECAVAPSHVEVTAPVPIRL